MELAPSQVKKIYDEASNQAKQFHDDGGETNLNTDRTNVFISANFRTSDSDVKAFPTDYQIFIFDAKPHNVSSDFDWNHGTNCGVAISKERSEVIYWAESW